MNIKNIIAMALMTGILGTSGCATTPGANSTKELAKAKHYAKQGEYYQARKTANAVLQQHPGNAEAKKLIAEVINHEVAEHKELFETRAPEEFTNDEQSSEIQAWLERSRSLLEIGEYDEALSAAEKVFSYDPENAEASRLVDEIKNTAMKDGKAEVMIRNRIARDESDEKIGLYLDQARKALQAGRVGTARLALDKIQLLDPENREALTMRRELENKQKNA